MFGSSSATNLVVAAIHASVFDTDTVTDREHEIYEVPLGYLTTLN